MNRLEDLGIKKAINKTRLKVRLLEHFPEALEQFDGRNTVIVFKKGMENMLKEALKKRDFSEDAMTLAKAATIVRMTFSTTRPSNLMAAFHHNAKRILFHQASSHSFPSFSVVLI